MTGQKWCNAHKQAAAAMLAPAEAEGPVAKQKHTEIMNDAEMSIDAMAHWCESNPIGVRWKRTSHVDVEQWRERYHTKTAKKSTDGKEPMTQNEFMKYATEDRQLDVQDALEWWKELDIEENAAPEWRSQKRVWVFLRERNEKYNERSWAGEHWEFSKQMKEGGKMFESVLREYVTRAVSSSCLLYTSDAADE